MMLGLVKIFHDTWVTLASQCVILRELHRAFTGILLKSCSLPLHPLEQTRNLQISNEGAPAAFTEGQEEYIHQLSLCSSLLLPSL